MSGVVVITGIMAAGKSTVAQLLAERFERSVHLRGDVDGITARPRHLVVLAPDPEVVARREAGRPKTGYGGGWTPADLDRGLREETPRIGLWLDNSEQTPAQTADAILERLDEARL